MSYKTLWINGASISEFQIVYPISHAIEEFLAEELAKKLLAVTGFKPAVVSDAEPESRHELRLGRTCRTILEATEPNTYRITVSGAHVEAVTNCVFGYDDLLAAFDTALSDSTGLSWADGTEWNGSVTNTPLIPDSYDVCILYHNILGYLPWYPTCNRAAMGLELYREYMPDIIGLQEVSNFYYSDSIDTIRAMEEMGYREIRFPRYGYGNPIYYNANRLMLLECGYKTARPGDKGTTWSVFELKRSGGKTFAVMNSHFAADSNANNDPILGNQYRTEDAKALVQVVEMTKQRYPGIPIFTGGDYNSGIHTDPLNAVLEGGLICLRDVARDHTQSDFCAYNGYPRYDKETNRYTYEKFHLRDVGHNIDFAMVAGNQTDVVVHDYVIMKDRISCTVSDHLPHLFHITLPTPPMKD